MYNFRTDLALERRDIYQKVNNLKQIDGIKSTEEEINEKLQVLKKAIENEDDNDAREALRSVVPTFRRPEEINKQVESI